MQEGSVNTGVIKDCQSTGLISWRKYKIECVALSLFKCACGPLRCQLWLLKCLCVCVCVCLDLTGDK